MAKQKPSSGLFQNEYIQRCLELGVPLNDKQIGALEETIHLTFGLPAEDTRIKIEKRDPLANHPLANQVIDVGLIQETYREMGSNTGSGNLLSAIRLFTPGEGYNYYESTNADATDAKALALYEACVKFIEQSPSLSKDPFCSSMAGVRELRSQLPSFFTYRYFRALHTYLYKRGLVEEQEAPLPRALRK